MLGHCNKLNENFNTCRLLSFFTKQTWSTHFPITFKFFLIYLCRQMSKYFGKCFGPSTRAPKFLTQMP